MAVVTQQEVQSWLESSKYALEGLDEDLEETARQLVFGRLTAARISTTGWDAPETTPELVRRIVAMLVAAWVYDRATAEDQLEGSSYADKLERRALGLLQSVIDGEFASDDIVVDDTLATTDSIVFFPTDAEDAERAPGSLDYDFSHARMFEVGMKF